jgi:hypothetical protein
MKRIALLIALTLTSITIPNSAFAANMVIKPSKTTDLAAEESVSITLENFPSKAGIYLQQCLQSPSNARSEDCNAQTQLWITNARGGSFTPTSAITMKLVAKFGTVDCTTQKCGIFARYDHTADTDTSEDQFIPITFSANPVVIVAPPKVIEKQSIQTLPKSLKAGKRLSLPIQTSQGVNITYRSASTKICTVKDNVVRAVKKGTCKLQLFAPANEKFEMFANNYSLRITR